jgi:hypothetical protein
MDFYGWDFCLKVFIQQYLEIFSYCQVGCKEISDNAEYPLLNNHLLLTFEIFLLCQLFLNYNLLS